MAEERIFIKYYEDTGCLHGYSVERTVELTRQEAIERMEKVLEEGWWSGKTFRQLSDVALNALLEGKK